MTQSSWTEFNPSSQHVYKLSTIVIFDGFQSLYGMLIGVDFRGHFEQFEKSICRLK